MKYEKSKSMLFYVSFRKVIFFFYFLSMWTSGGIENFIEHMTLILKLFNFFRRNIIQNEDQTTFLLTMLRYLNNLSFWYKNKTINSIQQYKIRKRDTHKISNKNKQNKKKNKNGIDFCTIFNRCNRFNIQIRNTSSSTVQFAASLNVF